MLECRAFSSAAQGPLYTVGIIAGGFYAIPVVRGIADGVKAGGGVGDVLANVQASIANPTSVLGGITDKIL